MGCGGGAAVVHAPVQMHARRGRLQCRPERQRHRRVNLQRGRPCRRERTCSTSWMVAVRASVRRRQLSTTAGGTSRRDSCTPTCFTTALSSPRSPSSAIVIARPPRPARAVRPTLCRYVSTLLGQSKLTTASTPRMSRPRAATSVASNSVAAPVRNVSSASSLADCRRSATVSTLRQSICIDIMHDHATATITTPHRLGAVRSATGGRTRQLPFSRHEDPGGV